MEYITKEAVQKCLDDLSSDNLIGNENDTFISLAKAKDKIEELPTADVVPRAEIAKIFEEIEKIITEPFTAGFNLLMPINQALREYTDSFRTELLYYVAELKEKYTEGGDDKQ